MFCPFFNYEKKIAKILTEKKLTVSTAESCTGGLISSVLTDVSGSSSFVLSNLVTYSNEAKKKFLKVEAETLEKFGAVSAQTAKEMAEGIFFLANTSIGLSITGIAGPLGGSKEKPVGLAYVGLKSEKALFTEKILLPKFLPRKFMKYCFAKIALYELLKFIERNF